MNLSRVLGFSLFELLTALAIVAILATISVPAYQGMVSKARRSDALAALLQVQLAQERWRSQHASYADSLAELGWSSPHSPDGHYHLQITWADSADFRVLAKPAGVQHKDACGTFAGGREGPVYAGGYAGPDCWHR
jgi:type IV pilus assembly protein PilE